MQVDSLPSKPPGILILYYEMATHSSIHAWKIPWTEEPAFPVTGPQPLTPLRRAENRASRPGHRALARSSLLRDWFPCAGAVLSLAQTHRGRPQTIWAQTEEPSGGGAASPSQGRWDPDSLRPALRLGGQATAGECSPGRSLCLTKSSAGTPRQRAPILASQARARATGGQSSS